MQPVRRILTLTALCVLGLAVTARGQSPAQDVAEGQKLYEAGKFEESLAKFQAARESLKPGAPELADRIDFNRACAMLALKQADQAEKTLREVDARTASPSVRSAARYNLGRIQADRADELAKTDPAKAIESLKAAERFFRNALAESPGDADAARNIELVQRKRAELMKQQQQEQQQQQQQKQDKKDQKSQDNQKQDQQDKKDQQDQQQGQDQKDSQKQGPDQSSADQNKQQKSDQKQQQDKQQEQQQQGEDQQDNADPQQSQSQQNDKAKQNKDQQSEPKPEQGKDDKKDAQKQAEEKKDGKEQAAQPQPADQTDKDQKDQKQAREFDVQSAQILDKERQRREQIRRMFQQMMRSRAAKVDKDW